MDNYITQKAFFAEDVEEHKITRSELMKKAGYSEMSVKSNNPELTKLYAVKVEDLINKTGFVLSEFVDAINKDVENGEIDKLSLVAKVKTLSMITQIFKGLSPSYKQKVSTKEADGTVKNVWTKIN